LELGSVRLEIDRWLAETHSFPRTSKDALQSGEIEVFVSMKR
jgi:hypothetical protein